MYAVISDIHSNIEALEAVMKNIRDQGVEEIICLGDVIGYGPSPIPCIDIAMENFSVTLSGNHEWAIVNEPVGFNFVARRAAQWHQKVLKPSWFTFGKKKARWNFVKDLPTTHQKDNIFFVHAAPQNPREEYILRSHVDEMLGEFAEPITKAFSMIENVCLVGHTHTPGVIFEDEVHFFSPEELDQKVEIDRNRKTIINIGSVGQPRDGNPKASYVTVDGDTIEYHRVEYDMEKTKEKVYANKYLENQLGDRLVTGS